MSQDLLEILTGEASTPAPAPRPTGTLSLPSKRTRMDPMDAMIRTIYGEAGSEEEHPWIAAVIANRAKASGKDLPTSSWSRGSSSRGATRRRAPG